MVENKKVLTPSVDRLNELPDGKCTVIGCGKVLRSSSALRCHMAKAHKEGSLTKKCVGEKIWYACPAKNCVRNANDPRQDFFPSLHRLRKHYLAKHAEKKFKCTTCRNSYGDESTLKRHEEVCRKLFYCLCGCYYATLLALKTHVTRKGEGHKVIGEKNLDSNEFKPVDEKPLKNTKVTIPALLVIPNASFQQNLVSFNTGSEYVKERNDSGIHSASNLKFVLPRTSMACDVSPNVRSKPFEKSGKTYDDKASFPIKDQTKFMQQKFHKKKEVPYEEPDASLYKISRFEEMIKFLSSKKTQNILNNKRLIKKTLSESKNLKFSCKHVDVNLFRNTLRGPESSSVKNMVNMCTQTNSQFLISNTQSKFAATETLVPQSNKEGQVDEATNEHRPLTRLDIKPLQLEEHETSDFGMQCEISFQDLQNATDTHTQTDLWLKDIEIPDFTNMETQTFPLDDQSFENDLTKDCQLETFFTNMETQTCNLGYKPSENSRNSLDGYVSDSNMVTNLFLQNEFSNISTQTASESWINEQLFNQQSTQTTNSDNALDFLNIDFAVEKNDQASQFSPPQYRTDNDSFNCNSRFLNSFGTQTFSLENSTSTLGTQTFDYVDTFLNESAIKNNIETQTAISFYDLLDSSLIDSFLNEDDFRNKTNDI